MELHDPSTRQAQVVNVVYLHCLSDFLRAACSTKASFLLTSRRTERDWLKDLPARIAVPRMPFQERFQLARVLAERHGRRLSDVEDWRPLLEFTEGNPMTLTVVVGQVLRDALDIQAFVEQLRADEAVIEDDATEGRSGSLAASLGYGFEHAFTETQRKQLALLHYFQGFVHVPALGLMARLTPEAAIALVDRAAEIGLLTAHGGLYYSIHPALPWFFKNSFDRYYSEIRTEADRAFVEAMGTWGSLYGYRYQTGEREWIRALAADEANLLHARSLAQKHGWWRLLTRTMQGLHALYEHTGRRAEWVRLVDQIVPDFVDPATDGPLCGREEEWGLVTDYRVRLAREARHWSEAERLERMCVEWSRQRATEALAASPETLDDARRDRIRALAMSLHELGEIRSELRQPDCVAAYEESLSLAERIGESIGAAVCTFNLGKAYKNLPTLRDLSKAERWYRRSLALHFDSDQIGRARCLGGLSNVAYERFMESQSAGGATKEALAYLQEAAKWCERKLELLPASAIKDLATTHYQLGEIYEAVRPDLALRHYRESIHYDEAAGNLYGAGQSRSRIALVLLQAGRLSDAREYALAALRNLQTYGDRAAKETLNAMKLLADIEQRLKP